MNILSRKIKISTSLGLRKSCYLLIYRFLGLFGDSYQVFKNVHREKRWHTKLLKLKENKDEVFQQDLTNNQKNKIKEYYSGFGWAVKNDWHNLYSHVNGFFSKKYIPEPLFYQVIEPTLNDFSKLGVYGDKNLYQKLYPQKYQPKTLLRSINNQLLTENYENISPQFIETFLKDKAGTYVLKPSRNSFGGRQIFLITIKDSIIEAGGEKLSFDTLARTYNGNYIIQEYIHQHKILNSLNPHSVNTVRAMTLRLQGEIHLLSSFLRLGNGKDFVDNITKGGMGIGIQHNGNFTPFGVNILLDKVDNLPEAIKESKITRYPNFELIKQTVLELHQNIFDFDLISWDMVLDKNSNPIMIENNLCLQSINISQTLNGPLFGDMTNNVLEYVSKNKTSLFS